MSVLSVKDGHPADVDSQLVQLLRDENDRALEELLRREGAKVLRLIQRLTGWHEDSYDLCQEVFIAAWRHGGRMQSDDALARWLTRVAINRCRTWNRRRVLSARFFHWLQGQTYGQTQRSETENVLDRDWVRQAVARLKPGDREVLVLRYMEHLEITQIATLLGIKRAAVDARLTRARDRLSQILTDEKNQP